MANRINLRAEEYQTIQTELKAIHENQLQNMVDVIDALKELVTSNDLFQVDYTSMKVLEMLEVASVDVVNALLLVFRDSEVGIANMIEATSTTDTVEIK